MVFSSGGQADRIYAASSATMLMVQGDPFLDAMISGVRAGSLLLQSRSGGIPTYGPPRPMRQSTFLSDRAILREIRSGVGGSFSNFLNKVFSTAEKRNSTQSGEAAEENPFAKPEESAPASQAPAASGAPSPGPQPEAKPANSSTPPADTKPADPPPPPIPLVTTVRPDIMLHVTEDGVLRATPAARLNEQTFETAETGIQRYNTLTFTNPAEIPAALAAADFNSDGQPDVCFVDTRTGMMRMFFGNSEGTYAEGMRVEIGAGPRSLAAGDFNGDGRMEVAISNVGVGTLTYIFLGPAGEAPSFRTLWIDTYRDYIAASDTSGSGAADLIGVNFANIAEVLDSIKGSNTAGFRFSYSPALDCRIATFSGYKLQLNAVLMGSNLSLNLQNLQQQLTNVINIQASPNIYLVVGDLTYNDTLSIALATLRK
jgi:hypothetical protein